MDCSQLWNRCLDVIKDNVSEVVFDTWFAPITALEYNGTEFLLQVPSQFFYEYIEEKYIDLLSKTIYRVVGEGTRLKYRIVMDKKSQDTTELPSALHNPLHNVSSLKKNAKTSAPVISNPFERTELEDIDPQLNTSYQFDNFIEGRSNQLARTAGLSIADAPGTTLFNPLFLHGQSGVGKSHLVNAIGVAAKAKNPKLRVLYVSANLFQNQYANAVRKGAVPDFVNFYQTIDLLIVDDIHEFIGKKQTQNTFFHIFNHLHQMKKQIILTCDRAPYQMQDLEERLLTRFKWGLTAKIDRPDTELRKAILKHKIYRDGLQIPDDVVTYVAEHVTESIRDLEGVLVSLLAQSTFRNLKIDVNLAQKVVADLVLVKPTEISVDKIKDVVSAYFNMEVDDMLQKSRKREIVQARQIAMFLAKHYTKQSLAFIGMSIGGRDHATVLHACKTVDDLMSTDKHYKSCIEEIEEQLKNA